MIFKPEMVEKILRLEKTQTRRPAKRHEQGSFYPCRYEVGKVYSVQPGRTKKGVARIRVTDVTLQRLDDISGTDARAEGFSGWVEFAQYWQRLYGRETDWSQPVWRIAFELCKEAA